MNVKCCHCGAKLNVPDEYAGRAGNCNHCKGAITVPQLPPRKAPSVWDIQRPNLESIEIDPDKPLPKPVFIPEGPSGKGSRPAKKFSILNVFIMLFAIFGALIALLMIATFPNYQRTQPTRQTTPRQAAPAFFAPRPELATLSEFLSLQNGMSYQQACEIIGGQGTTTVSSHVDGIAGFTPDMNMVMYSWQGNGGPMSNMNATFQNGQLVGKAQLGLR